MTLARRSRLVRRRQTILLVAALALYSTLAALVARGHLDAVDSYAVRNLMPFHEPSHHGTSLLEQLLAYHGHSFHAGRFLRLPASVLLSFLLAVFCCCWMLWRRGDARAAIVWFSVFAVANVVELACKAAITKPTLYEVVDGRLSPFGLSNSFPSGHAARAAIVSAMVVVLWRRVWPLVGLWLVLVVVTLELDGIHTPSDLAGGLLLASAAVLLAVRLTTPRPTRSMSEGAAAEGPVAGPGHNLRTEVPGRSPLAVPERLPRPD